MNLSELQALGAKPIRPDAPAGDSARDTPEFELLQGEIRKLEAPDQPAINWEGVGKSAQAILSDKSKDLMVASYLTLAAYETDGFAGLAAGLGILRDYVEQFWGPCFPERPRGRAAAFEWLSDRGSRSLGRNDRRVTAEGVQACLDLVTALEDKVGSLLDVAPMMGDLRRALEEAANRVAPSAPAPSTSDTSYATTTSSYAAPAAPSGPPPITAVESPEDFESTLEEVRRLGDLCAGWLRGQDPTDAMGYRLLRMLAWRDLKECPPNEDGVTVLPDFDVTVLENLDQLAKSGEHAEVLAQTEALFPTAPLWFDLTRHAAQALDAQGKEYAPAVEAVQYELATLLRRVPEVLKLKTENGVPFADEATRKWVAKKVMAGSGIDIGPLSDTPAGVRPRGGEGFADAQKEVRKLSRGNKLGAALKILSDGALKSESLPDRVAWKLEAARLCLQGGRLEMALAQLEALDEELRRSSIEDWDPALCAEILRDLLRCRQQVAQTADFAPSELARSRELMGRLCRLDVVSALELNGKE